MGRTCNMKGRMRRNAYNILIESSEGKNLLGKLRCRWKNNVKIDFRDIRV
jgi:hypothetical protein